MTYERNGNVVILVNNESYVSGKVAGGLLEVPQDGLQVGEDRNGAVGDYEEPFSLKMTGSFKLDLK
jgi:hypothetical protein